MKKLLSLCISMTLLLMLPFPGEVKAEDRPTPSRQVPLKKQPQTDTEHTIIKPEGHRIPSRPVLVTIGIVEGVYIEDQTPEISLYEIWDTSCETCIYTTCDENDFVNTLFANEGEYVIRFINAEYIYSGHIEL